MAYCFYIGISNRGHEMWGNDDAFWTRLDCVSTMEDSIVKHCRKAFGNRYKDMWIDVVYFDDKYYRYTEDFFSEVGVMLYPKITNLKKELIRRGIKSPKTKEEWVDYRRVVYEIAHNDISINKERRVKPINIVVNGVRYSDSKGNFHEKFKSVNKVKKLASRY